MYFQSSSADELYKQLCYSLLKYGKEVSPRELNTKEIISVVAVLTNPRNRIFSSNERKFSLSYGIGEWLWYMRGSNKLKIISYYSPSIKKYSDDGITMNGAYGPRIIEQLHRAIELLKKDTNSRRAVVSIYNKDDLGKVSNDIPCTVCLEFFIRDNKLNLITFMRSNDLYLGFPNDVFAFTMIQEYVANMLEMDLGTYYHHIGSIHYYKENEEKISAIANEKLGQAQCFPNLSAVSKNMGYILAMEEKLRLCRDLNFNMKYYTEDQGIDLILKTLKQYSEKRQRING